MNNSYPILLDKLDEFIRKYYKNQLIKGVLYSVSGVLLFYISVTVSEYFAHFNSSVRTTLFYAFFAGSGFIIVKYIFIPLLKLNKLGKIISHEQAAEIIGKHFNNIEDKLHNVLQLQSLTHNSSLITHNLIEASIEQKIKTLKPIPFGSAIDLSENKKYLKYALPPVLILVVILFAAPTVITDGTKRLVAHNTYFEQPAPFEFFVENKNLQTIQQEDFLLEIKINGSEIPDNAYIEIKDNQFKLNKESKLNFQYLFKNIQNSTKFKLFADGFYSKEYELVALPNPIVLNFGIELNYPKYIGKNNETIENTGDLIIPAGTKVKWNFNTRNAKALRMGFNDSTFTLVPFSENLYSFTQTVLKSSSYSIKTANEYLISKDSVRYAINVIADIFPSIEVESSVDTASSKRIYFKGMVKDDYGFKQLSFNYKRSTSPDLSKGEEIVKRDTTKNTLQNPLSFGEGQSETISIPISKNQKQEQFFHLWDLSALNINAGDNIEYYFEIWDNDGVNGSKSTRSQKMIFKAPTLKEISEKTEKNNDEIKKDLEASIKEAKDLQKELNELNKKLMEKRSLGWEEKKKLEDILNKQKSLQNKIEEIKNENKENNKQQSEYKELDERIMEKQQQLQELFDEVMNDEMKDKFKQLEKLMEEMNKDKLQDAMEQMKMENKDVEKELDRQLELFKQLEVEQKTQEAIDKLNELSNKQEQLSEKALDKNSEKKEIQEEMKTKQDELNKEFEEFKKDVESLEKKNSELEEPNKMPDTKEEKKNIEEEMKKSSEELGNKKNSKASKSQKSAAKKMKELAEKMEQSQSESEAQQAEEDINDLRAILENLIHLSMEQENLMQQLKNTDKNNPQYVEITKLQKNLKDDAKMVEDSLFALSKRVPDLKSFVNKEISEINSNIEKAIKHLAERQTSYATNRQQSVMTAENNLALLLSEVVEQMQQKEAEQKQSKGKGGSCKKPKGSCSKPGQGKPKQSAASMKKMQEQINKQIQKLKGEMEKAGGPPKKGKQGKDGMGGSMGSNGKNGMSKELAKLAAQQEALRNQLQQIAQDLDKNGKGGTGNLKKLQQEMEKTETDLVNKQITQETLKRQQEIMTRLLEAENAEREREMDEKRESQEGKNEERTNPSEFLEYKRQKQKEAELLKTVPPTLNPFYKNKVSEYFNTINQEE